MTVAARVRLPTSMICTKFASCLMSIVPRRLIITQIYLPVTIRYFHRLGRDLIVAEIENVGEQSNGFRPSCWHQGRGSGQFRFRPIRRLASGRSWGGGHQGGAARGGRPAVLSVHPKGGEPGRFSASIVAREQSP